VFSGISPNFKKARTPKYYRYGLLLRRQERGNYCVCYALCARKISAPGLQSPKFVFSSKWPLFYHNTVLLLMLHSARPVPMQALYQHALATITAAATRTWREYSNYYSMSSRDNYVSSGLVLTPAPFFQAGPPGYFIHVSITTPVVSALKNYYTVSRAF
jgi:hypothetical protein